MFAVAPLPVLPSPTRHSYIWSVFILVFLDYENQKTIFISDFIIIDTVSRSFVTHEKLCQIWIFNKLESVEQEIKNTILTSVPSKNLKIEDYRLVFLFLKNNK